MKCSIWDKLCDRYIFCDKIDEIKWACWRTVRDFISPIWYRFFGHKHHLVRTKLIPQVWYDSDTRMLYAVMAIVEWFVENDMQLITKEEFEKELESIKAGESEYLAFHIESWVGQYEKNQEIIRIYKWWKDYPNREKEISDALTAWHDYNESFSDKEDFLSFLEAKNNMSEEQRAEENRLSEHLHNLEKMLETEEQEMLKKAIDLRACMWS